ncbi:Lariat debranching enzyme [Colletotrichum shisoi]|uniref:Lariat debranching enzyme n=1 Tax=Colletotrichum shisoi TaxID=2078593 RepID=A0A5Q4BSX8_9PEZI|nr:Lariat debranching enzyme [Colletotrichum shisoi]
MGLFDFKLTYQWLYWTAPTGEPPAAPEGLTRHWVETPSGQIEVLSNQGADPTTTKPPIFFVHGGMGSAWVWTEYMQYFAEHGIPCYAVSLRGHGNSWHPSYMGMVYLTTRQNLADDAIAAIKWVQERQGSEVLLVGHSSGGGLAQGILSANYGVYANWVMFDPWFAIRMLFHGRHPNSPLSNPFLVKQAFFGDQMPDSAVLKFQKHVNRYESFLWPISMMRPFTTAASIAESISGWGSSERIMVMAGTQDKMMTHDVMSKLAALYRTAFAELVGSKKLDAKVNDVEPLSGEGGNDDKGSGISHASQSCPENFAGAIGTSLNLRLTTTEQAIAITGEMATQTFETNGVRIAVEGCGHGTLNAIYAAVAASCEARGWDGVDLLIIGGDFQAARNAADLTVMSVPAKYRELGDFWEYYAGHRTAPYLTVFAGGNHEAASHMWELFYGGWAAPNIYYLGAANVLRLGPLRIAGMSGIWKGFDYRKAHHERLPMGPDEIKSFYHVREVDVRKLLLLREQVDVGISHDWPRAIERWGDEKALWRMKPDFERESKDGTLGNVAAEYVCDRLRPPYWFSAHLHCKFAALKIYKDESAAATTAMNEAAPAQTAAAASVPPAREPVVAPDNPDEIDLDGDEEVTDAPAPAASANPDEIGLDDDDDDDGENENGQTATSEKTTSKEESTAKTSVPDEIRAQLPASFTRPPPQPKRTPGQPVPPTITNKQVNFLALDKCLPRRHFLQLLEVRPHNVPPASQPSPTRPLRLQYDPEWLAITRVFHSSLTIGDPSAQPIPDLGEEHYAPLIDAERRWVEENIVAGHKDGGLDVPLDFAVTAPPHTEGEPESVPHQPFEYTSPQTAAFCAMLGLENLWDAGDEERMERRARGPPAGEFRGHRGGAF